MTAEEIYTVPILSKGKVAEVTITREELDDQIRSECVSNCYPHWIEEIDVEYEGRKAKLLILRDAFGSINIHCFGLLYLILDDMQASLELYYSVDNPLWQLDKRRPHKKPKGKSKLGSYSPYLPIFDYIDGEDEFDPDEKAKVKKFHENEWTQSIFRGYFDLLDFMATIESINTEITRLKANLEVFDKNTKTFGDRYPDKLATMRLPKRPCFDPTHSEKAE
jgi:hypothetical protein